MSRVSGGLSSSVPACHERGGSQQPRTHIHEHGGGRLSSRLPRSEAQGVSAVMHTPPVSQIRGSWALIGRVCTCHEHVRPQQPCAHVSRVCQVSAATHPRVTSVALGGLSIPHPHIARARKVSALLHCPSAGTGLQSRPPFPGSWQSVPGRPSVPGRGVRVLPCSCHPRGGPTAGSDLCPQPRLAAGARGITWNGHNRSHRRAEPGRAVETDGGMDGRMDRWAGGEGWVLGVPPGISPRTGLRWPSWVVGGTPRSRCRRAGVSPSHLRLDGGVPVPTSWAQVSQFPVSLSQGSLSQESLFPGCVSLPQSQVSHSHRSQSQLSLSHRS